jgi:hypothetical protein
MAKAYRAVTQIQHGFKDGSVKVFEPGAVVKGLDKETMKQLWDAGALEEATVLTPLDVEDASAESTEDVDEDVESEAPAHDEVTPDSGKLAVPPPEKTSESVSDGSESQPPGA